MRRSDHAGPARQGLAATDSLKAAIGEDAQKLGLQRCFQIADLVEKQRASSRKPSRPARRAVAPVNAPFFMPEQLAFDQRAGQSGEVDGDKRLRCGFAVFVDGAPRALCRCPSRR